MKSKDQNYAFIDSQNLNLAIRQQGWKLHFGRFRKYLEDKFNITKAFLFIGLIPTKEDLYKTLQEQGYILIFKPTLKLPGGKYKGNVDAELVLQAMIEYDKYNKAVIVSGDGDFYCLVKYLKKNNKLKKLIIPDRNHYSSLFREFIQDDVMFLNNLKRKLEYRKAH